MSAVEVIERPAAAAAALDPTRARLLALLAQPGSATSLADRVGLPRQQVNYHLRILETHGLIRLVEQRQRRGLKERVLVATAEAYVVSPGALGAASVDPTRTRDHLSADFLVALAARAVREVGTLLRRARATGLRLPALSLDTEIRFRSTAERSQCAAELADAVALIAARYHAPDAPDGRDYRLTVLAHPIPAPEEPPPSPSSTADTEFSANTSHALESS